MQNIALDRRSCTTLRDGGCNTLRGTIRPGGETQQALYGARRVADCFDFSTLCVTPRRPAVRSPQGSLIRTHEETDSVLFSSHAY